MTEKEFFNIVSNGSQDVLQLFLEAVSSAGAQYCVIGGLAVNAYVEPVVSLDLDVVVAAEDVERVCKSVEGHFRVERFAHSVNLTSAKSSLRIQLQTDPRYLDFINRATFRTVLGYKMRVAGIEDVLQGKVWAYLDEDRRGSKRQKDLADIARLVEAFPDLIEQLPDEIRKRLQ
jgi:hypothetical protein